ncbi:restriction endonuclease [Micromonospora sp. NPDC000668]|uniref:restriction endonuclease n=1 Tax=Micromonospora sp. NPDC000668 TaxID=3364219 RepID=UPI00369ACEB6
MTEPTGEPASHDEDKESPDGLSTRTRIAAIIFGLAGTGTGGWAVFSSDNQAGTAILLLIGAVLLLVGVQGTPLRRFGHGDSSIELAAVQRRAARAVERAAQEQPPEVAAAVAEAVETITHQVSLPPEQVYEAAVIDAMRRTGASIDPTHRPGPGDKGVDARVQVGTGKVNVQVKLRRRGSLGARDIELAAAKARWSGFDGGFLLVTNAPLSDDARAFNAALSPTGDGVEAITWNDSRDDGLLARALARNAR